jgi:heme/copper-type cytochrome/quinol oxidase subunit 1
MTRAGLITAHLGALPAGIALSVLFALVTPSSRAVDVELHDTYFVVAHFHLATLLAACVLVVTLVAYSYGALNRALLAAWVFLLIHLACAWMLRQIRLEALASQPDVFGFVSPAHPGLGYLYLASAVAGILAVLAGMVMSLVTALRNQA